LGKLEFDKIEESENATQFGSSIQRNFSGGVRSMKHMKSKGVIAALAAGAIALGVGVSTLIPRPGVKITGSVEIPTNTPTVAVPTDQAPPPVLNPSTPTVSQPVQTPQLEPIPIPEKSVKINKVQVTEKGIEVVPSDLPIKETSKSVEDNLRTAFGEMLNNKSVAKGSKGKTSSEIPAGTKLLSLKADKTGVRVDLSEEFEKPGGATSLQARLAQVIYTATSLDRNAKVWISVNGKELRDLGGLELDQPITRSSLKKDFDSIQGAQ
jgi:Sporulation and spore germination